ncbi:hypothetical protein BC937DRAFT_93107 [Endogone sp. FLAS-F59071]|nr:hypothetical protein BC937DRAFT_93107 [Endogone sp. FLAS-F59071]|eukprot:RUS21282.1 hypothetical protein BC937DRAFT_93107 [Endogone sp. FLAS-F59071]
MSVELLESDEELLLSLANDQESCSSEQEEDARDTLEEQRPESVHYDVANDTDRANALEAEQGLTSNPKLERERELETSESVSRKKFKREQEISQPQSGATFGAQNSVSSSKAPARLSVTATESMSFTQKLVMQTKQHRQQQTEEEARRASTFATTKTDSSNANAEKSIQDVPAATEATIGEDDLEIYSGLRLKTRATTVTLLTEHIKNHTFIRLASVCKHFGVPINPLQDSTRPKDWITIGVLAGKSPPRTTTNGDKYCVIKLTDLKDTTVNLFLFRDVWKAWWKKLTNGMVVAILNPKILKPTEVNGLLGIELDHADKLLHIGTSLDLANCQAIKRDGQRCTAFIDRRAGDYCEFHVVVAYKKTRRQRMEFATGNSSIDVRAPNADKGGGPGNVRSLSSAAFVRHTEKPSIDSRGGETYISEGGGIVSGGIDFKKKPRGKKGGNDTTDKKTETELMDFILKQSNTGAHLLRQMKSSKATEDPKKSDKTVIEPTGTFSAEAIRRMGFNPLPSGAINRDLEKDRKGKERSIQLLKQRQKTVTKSGVSGVRQDARDDDKLEMVEDESGKYVFL